MAFDTATRNELQRMVGAARACLVDEFTTQCQRDYGIQPDGSMQPLESLGHLDEDRRVRAALLRERARHIAAGLAGKTQDADAVKSLVREQAFTVLNRLCALRMCEERGLLQECIRGGYESKGFRLFGQATARPLGATYERYRLYLELLFDELAVDLGVLFDRYSLHGLLGPGRERTQGHPRAHRCLRAGACLGGRRGNRLGLPVLQFGGGTPSDAPRVACAPQQPRTRRAQSVFHPKICRRVPHGQHARTHLVRDAKGRNRTRQALSLPSERAILTEHLVLAVCASASRRIRDRVSSVGGERKGRFTVHAISCIGSVRIARRTSKSLDAVSARRSTFVACPCGDFQEAIYEEALLGPEDASGLSAQVTRPPEGGVRTMPTH